MRFFRNTEFRVELILLTILFVAAIIGMYMQCGTIAAVYLLIFCGVIFCLYISYSVVKYRKMASLAEQIGSYTAKNCRSWSIAVKANLPYWQRVLIKWCSVC